MSTSRRTTRRLAAAGVAFLTTLLSACQDATAPELNPVNSGYLTISAATYANSSIDFKKLYPKLTTQVPSRSTKGDTTLQKFTVNPENGKLIIFGKTSGHIIAIPPNTLCHPTNNTYGPTEWLKPCQLATASVRFEVRTWIGADGRPHADFSPDIRFDPSAPEPVRIFFQDPKLVSYNTVRIPFCSISLGCVDEGLTDSFLETYASPRVGGGFWVYRNLRHFSGYNVTAD